MHRSSSTPRLVCLVSVVLCCAVAQAQTSEYGLRFYGTGVGPPGQQDRALLAVDDNTAGPDASTPIDIGQGSFTIEFWMRGLLADNATGNSGGDIELNDYSWIDANIILDRDVWCGTANAFGVSLAGGLVRFGIDGSDQGGGADTIEGSEMVLDGEWHHVALVRDASAETIAIVVDGALDFVSDYSHGNDLSYPDVGVPVTGDCGTGQLTAYGWYLVIAAEKHDASSQYPSYSGFFDELRIWSVARTGQQIAQARFADLSAQAGLVGEYRFEEGGGVALADSSGASSPDGTLIAGTSGNGEWVSRSADVLNTAPLSMQKGTIFNDGFEAGSTIAWTIIGRR